MERIAFILEHNDERLSCLLNPEQLVLKRRAGVKARQSLGGALTKDGLADDPLLFTGGGTTVIDFELLFDVALPGSTVQSEDVRDLTAPFWELAENAKNSEDRKQLAQVRFVWGKSWNIPGVVISVAEKFDRFTESGIPTRSWITMRFVRVMESASTRDALRYRHRFAAAPQKREDLPEEELEVHQVTGEERLDVIAEKYYGDPAMWKPLAEFNHIDDPLEELDFKVIYLFPFSKLIKE